MSTWPDDSVFRPPTQSLDTHTGPNATAPDPTLGLHPPATDVEQVNSELLTIAGTIEMLQERLEHANARLSEATKVETTEYELGQLFVEAQRFSEASLAHLETKIHEILREAEVMAKRILLEATEEAHEIRRRAQEDAVASKATARELQVAIAGFTSVNHELLRELGALNSMLDPEIATGTSQTGSSLKPEIA